MTKHIETKLTFCILYYTTEYGCECEDFVQMHLMDINAPVCSDVLDINEGNLCIISKLLNKKFGEHKLVKTLIKFSNR